MKTLLNLMLKGITAALTAFAILGMVWDIRNGGNYIMGNWAYTKMVAGSVVVGIGFSVPALVYYNPNIPYGIKVILHMGIGCTVLLITSFAVGWVPVSLGVKECVLAVVIELFIAFFLWMCFTLHYRKLAKRMNEKIKNKKAENI